MIECFIIGAIKPQVELVRHASEVDPMGREPCRVGEEHNQLGERLIPDDSMHRLVTCAAHDEHIFLSKLLLRVSGDRPYVVAPRGPTPS